MEFSIDISMGFQFVFPAASTKAEYVNDTYIKNPTIQYTLALAFWSGNTHLCVNKHMHTLLVKLLPLILFIKLIQ